MLWRWQRKLKVWKFNRQIRDILDTPPMPVVDAPWSIVSMVAKQDAVMYLLSMKSFYSRIGKGKIFTIIDRDTPRATQELLERHLPGIRFVILEDIDTGACQRGGTWERLCYIIDRSAYEYVVQLDCDTLPLGPEICEVLSCIEQRKPFTMADGWGLQTMREAAAEAQGIESDYVGIVAERLFDGYPDCDRLRYVRGSSGLAGFAKGGFSRSQLEEFHTRMQELLGERWGEWGTEQCGSNFAVANSPAAVVLPFPAYASFGPGGSAERTKFFHFIGTSRFYGGFFAEHGRKAIESLKAAQLQ
jgi:hypothetical protein